MSLTISLLVAALLGYILGAIPFGYLVARAHGVDILREGSGNPGATNVGRVVGKRAGRTVFALDFLKGALAVGWVWVLPLEETGLVSVGLVGLVAAILGHSFSVFLRGKGGKGVATTMGGLLVLMPGVVLVGLLVWLAVFTTSRYVSLASILFAVSLPISNILLGNSLILTLASSGLAIFIVVRHRSNIERLMKGTENRFRREKSGTGRQQEL
jgi:acyl phosphate:glycerol-3-phosphate acyltransferase